MDKQEIAYCGLSCTTCRGKFASIRNNMKVLDASFAKLNFAEMAKVIPLMQGRYKGYRKLEAFFSQECPGCHSKGGNPFCGIRKCAVKRGYSTCAECGRLCNRFTGMFKVHQDNEIQNNIRTIKEKGLKALYNKRTARAKK